ncbi:hypothetical protein BJP40_00995 [Streptomyces sp. CC53]|uniref:hypothetical protein n=1 Tax=Streptomyces sp. CC53 TaxID=1906740 RepID=UPI0008DD4A30|nr:hypothetical protein [Streptomyces sp. CC53]OII65510.1 hypothetical protein BJP40_00995 [Streptomyces sp. CC53]
MPLHIAFHNLDALRERCDIATVSTASDTEAAYEPGAVIPSGPWRPLPDTAGHAFTPPPETPANTLVEIVRPPVPAHDRLDDLARPLGDDQAQYIGQALAKPDMLTTTDNYQDGRLIGLHLDNWDKLAYEQKPLGRRRLALNLGPGTRYIILGALDAQAVCHAVHPNDYTSRYPHTDDYRTHVAAGHPIQVIRIRLSPGEGYIAPTEYLLHDGSTEGQDSSAVAFWLGRWPRAALTTLI